MHTAPVSVIVVSRARPAELTRCLAGVAQQDHVNFEVVVVTDPAGTAALRRHGWTARIKTVAFDGDNISEARNRGIAAAAGDVCAFIDDDAVPEPTWLTRLTRPFDDARVAAAGGFVRGRNGISFQWRAHLVDATGRTTPLVVGDTRPSLHAAAPGRAVKTEGTNMAVRRDVLCGVGGFDPAFRFYMDETDLNMRLAGHAGLTAIVPLAQVHHGVAASAHRRGDRVPTSLREIGASTAVFLRKHAPEADWGRALHALETQQRRRLLRHMISGALEPRDIPRLMTDLFEGVEAGMHRPLGADTAALAAAPPPFLRLEDTGPRPPCILAGWSWQHRRLIREARAAAGDGALVTVFRFSPTALYHRMRFDPRGFWVQTGGLFGRAERESTLVRVTGFATRLRAECNRLAPLRPVDTLLY